jgi:hypothetical protein
MIRSAGMRILLKGCELIIEKIIEKVTKSVLKCSNFFSYLPMLYLRAKFRANRIRNSEVMGETSILGRITGSRKP